MATVVKKEKVKVDLELPVLDMQGKKIDIIRLDDKVFDGKVNIPLLHQVVYMYQANLRSGCASTKNRSEVRGGGKKPWRQKGTGRARTGSIRNPLWKGGGVIFGPHPRDFSYTVPKKMTRKAIKSSLNEKILNKNLIVIEELKLPTPKTKEILPILDIWGIDKNEKVLMVLEKIDKNIKLATRNLSNLSIRQKINFNALDVLRHHKLIIQSSVLKNLMKILQ